MSVFMSINKKIRKELRDVYSAFRLVKEPKCAMCKDSGELYSKENGDWLDFCECDKGVTLLEGLHK